MKIGDTIEFGKYYWRILDIQDDKALIITDNVVEKGYYHGTCFDNTVKITWADCDLRKYLNKEFFDGFCAKDKWKIIPVTNQNPDNPWYKTNGGEDTQDKIFLLSLDEVCIYFGDSTAKLKNKSGRRLPISNTKHTINDENDNLRIAKTSDGQYSSWMLRSPGCLGFMVSGIYLSGGVAVEGFPAHPPAFQVGIRPALWLKLY